VRAVLTYHSLDTSGSPISVAPDVFRAQMRWLASARLRVVGLETLLTLPVSVDAVAITFDDGFDNLWEEGVPVLGEFELPATVFVVSQRAGADNGWDSAAYGGVPTLSLMDWDRVGRLAEQGFEIGGHSQTHPVLTSVRDDRLESELEGCAVDIERYIGVRPRSFAYPFGAVDTRVSEAVSRVYERGCSTELRTVPTAPDPMAIPRLDMFYFRGPGQLEAYGTARFRTRLAFRRHVRKVREVGVRLIRG
jgi:peptidoglycan/xylan/chitin deacetylase (PgdA/CDA1 family)